MAAEQEEYIVTDTFPELQERDKKVKSCYWENLLAISDWVCLADELILHQSIFFSTLDTSISGIFLISLIAVANTEVTSQNKTINKKLGSSLSINNLSANWLNIVITLLLILWLVKLVCLYQKAMGKLDQGKNKPFMLTIIQLTTVMLSLFFFPIIEVAVSAVVHNGIGFQIMAIILLIVLPSEVILHYLTTADYDYTKRNRLEGRDYGLHTIRLLGSFVLAVYRFSTREVTNASAHYVNNFLHLIFACILIQRLITRNNFLNFSFNFHTTVFSLALHLVACIIQIVVDSTGIEYDWTNAYLYLVVLTPLIWISIWKATHLYMHHVLLKNMTTEKQDVVTSVYYLEVIFHLFTGRDTSNEYWITLLQAMMLHTKLCSDPLCMCYMIKDKYQYSLGPTHSLYSRELNRFFNLHSLGSVWNNLTTLGDRLSVVYRKEQHTEFVTTRVNTSTKRITISTDAANSAEIKDSEWIHDFHSDENFKIMLATFYYTIYNKHRERSDCLPLVDSLARYLISEYGNQVSALSMLYEHVYSRYYANQASMLSDWKLQNLIAKARRLQMQQQEFSQKTANSRFNFAKVLEYRLRLEKMSVKISEAISDKIQLYSELGSSEIDYLMAIKTGSKIFKSLKSIQSDIQDLMQNSDKNFDLLRESAVFEMCVQEKPYLSDRLQKKLTAFLEDRQNRGNVSENSEKAKLSFSVYDSSNIVLFLSFEDNDYRCNSFTKNAVDLFGAPAEDIQGNTLTEFMPREVGVSHNRLLFDFLNGNSKAKKTGKFNSFVISRQGKIKSATVQPKLDAAFLDNVYIAGLAVPRQKNRNPIVYTTHTGLVVGMNLKAHDILNSTLEEMGTNIPIFTTIPGLYESYLPEDWPQQEEDSRSISRRNHKTQMSAPGTQKNLNQIQAIQQTTFLDASEKSMKLEIIQTQALMFQIEKQLVSGLQQSEQKPGLTISPSPSNKELHATTGDQPLELTGNLAENELVQDIPDLTMDKKHSQTVPLSTITDDKVEIVMTEDKNKKHEKKHGHKKHKKKKQNISYRANMTRLNVEGVAVQTKALTLDEVLDKQRDLLRKKNVRIFKSTLSVENNRFQGQLLYKEVEIKGHMKSGSSERSVLKLLDRAPTEILEEVLMSNPGCLSLYNKASLYMRICNSVDELIKEKGEPVEKVKKSNLEVQEPKDRVRLNTEIHNQQAFGSGKGTQLVIHKVSPEDNDEEDSPMPFIRHNTEMLGNDGPSPTPFLPEGSMNMLGEDGTLDPNTVGNYHQLASPNMSPVLKVEKPGKPKKSAKFNVPNPSNDEAITATHDDSASIQPPAREKITDAALNEVGIATAVASSPVDVLLAKNQTAMMILKKKHKEFQSRLFDAKEELIRIAKNPDMVERVIEYISQARESEFSFLHTYTKHSLVRSQLVSACGDHESAVTADNPNSLSNFDGAHKIEGLLDEMVANTEESSDEDENTDNRRVGGNRTGGQLVKGEDRSHETKPAIAPGQSTYAKSSRKDFTTASEAIFTRDSIENADKNLQYHNWTYVMLIAVILCFSMKTCFSLLLVNQNYKYVDAAKSERRVASLMESVGFFGRFCSDIALGKQLILSSTTANLQTNRHAVYDILKANRFSEHVNTLSQLSKQVDISMILVTDLKNISPQTQLMEKLTVSEAIFKLRLASLHLAMLLNQSRESDLIDIVAQSANTNPKSFLEVIRIEVSNLSEQISTTALSYLSDSGNRKQGLWIFWWVLIILNLFGEVYSLFAYPTIIGKIILSIQHQTFRASEVLLRIDKSVFRKAIYRIITQTTPDESGNDESTVYNRAGSNLLRRKDLQNDVSIRLAIEHAQEAVAAGSAPNRDIYEDDGSVIMPVVGRKKQPRALAPKKFGASRNDKKGYSIFTNRVAPYSTGKTYTLTCSIVIFFDILYVAGWIYSYTTLSNLKLVMDNSVLFATAKGSTTALGTSFNYKYLKNSAVDFQIFGKSISNLEATYLDFVNKAENIKVDQYSSSLLYENFCGTATQGSASQLKECLDSLRIPQDTSVYQGMKEIESRLRMQKYLVDDSKGLVLAQAYYLSENYIQDQRLIEYEISTMTKIDQNIENFINTQSDSFTGIYLVMLYIHIISKVLLVCFFIWVWVPRRLDHWTWIRHTFLTLNNDILSNIYVKTYFVNEMGG